MKFVDFLNEAPYIDDKINPRPNAVTHAYKKLNVPQSDVDEHKFKSYIIKIYDEDATAFLVDKNDNPLIMTEYALDDYFVDYLFQNEALEKGTLSKLEKNLVPEFIVALAKLLNANGIISDTSQSIGGKKTWETLVGMIGDKSKSVGLYNNDNGEVQYKDKGMKSNEWFKIASTEAYGDDKEHYQLFIIF